MLVSGSGAGILRHHAHQPVRHVRLLQPGDLLLCESQIHGGRCAFHMMAFCGSHDGRGHLCQKLGQRDLRHGHAPSVGELGHAADDDIVLFGRGIVFEARIIVLLKAL